jgi:acyl-CoA reductase-like NAD-dependent aldehyde dehydrogenase
MITFTGSVPVGKEIRAAAGLKRVTLELGGNAAVLLEPDADLDVAVARAVVGGYALAGQSCISVQRVYAHRSIYAEFVERFTADVRELVVGHPLDPATQVASLISEEAARRVEEWIAEAVEAGAQLLTGGVRTGSVITPAVLTGVPEGVRLSCEEVFGPVVAIYPYDDLDQAIAAANRTRYGLQAGIFTRDLERAFWAAGRLQFGGVMINDIPTFRADHMPYGGVKESGLGREGPRYAAEEMTERKLICWRIPSTSSAIQAVTEPRP